MLADFFTIFALLETELNF